MEKTRIHRLTLRLSYAWNKNPEIRTRLISSIRELYPEQSEIIVCSRTMMAIGVISPSGRGRKLVPPQPVFPLWRADNNPRPADCYCRNFFEPDIQAPWSAKKVNEHHAFCAYRPNLALGAMYAELERTRALNSIDVHAALKRSVDNPDPELRAIADREATEAPAPKIYVP